MIRHSNIYQGSFGYLLNKQREFWIIWVVHEITDFTQYRWYMQTLTHNHTHVLNMFCINNLCIMMFFSGILKEICRVQFVDCEETRWMIYPKSCARILFISIRIHGITFQQSIFSNVTACNSIYTVPWPQKKQRSTL